MKSFYKILALVLRHLEVILGLKFIAQLMKKQVSYSYTTHTYFRSTKGIKETLDSSYLDNLIP